MDLTNFAIAFLILISSILSIATSSIALECYQKYPDMKTQKTGNFYFTISNIAFSSILTLLCLRSMYNMYQAGFQ